MALRYREYWKSQPQGVDFAEPLSNLEHRLTHFVTSQCQTIALRLGHLEVDRALEKSQPKRDVFALTLLDKLPPPGLALTVIPSARDDQWMETEPVVLQGMVDLASANTSTSVPASPMQSYLPHGLAWDERMRGDIVQNRCACVSSSAGYGNFACSTCW